MHPHTHTHSHSHVAALTITQGRIIPGTPINLMTFQVVGIATVELGGNPAGRPTYFFDCITTRNNGSGIMWERMSTPHQFDVGPIPDGSAGKRLNAGGIDYPDLDIYTCSDQYSDDVISVNITACKFDTKVENSLSTYTS